MKYSDFIQQIRDKTKDVLDAATPKVISALVGRHTLAGLRKIMVSFPETRLDSRGKLLPLPTEAFSESTAGDNELPIPSEFDPALEAYVLAAIYGSDAEDVKDESLFRYWDKKYKELVGEA